MITINIVASVVPTLCSNLPFSCLEFVRTNPSLLFLSLSLSLCVISQCPTKESYSGPIQNAPDTAKRAHLPRIELSRRILHKRPFANMSAAIRATPLLTLRQKCPLLQRRFPPMGSKAQYLTNRSLHIRIRSTIKRPELKKLDTNSFSLHLRAREYRASALGLRSGLKS